MSKAGYTEVLIRTFNFTQSELQELVAQMDACLEGFVTFDIAGAEKETDRKIKLVVNKIIRNAFSRVSEHGWGGEYI